MKKYRQELKFAVCLRVNILYNPCCIRTFVFRSENIKSDRLSLEFKKLREVLETVSDIDEMVDIANECKALLNQLIIITKG